MPSINGGSAINSLNSFKDEFFQPFPNIRVRRYLAYAKIPTTAGTNTIPLMIPSRQKGVDDKQLQIGNLEIVYSVRGILTVPAVVGTNERLKVAGTLAAADAWLASGVTATGKLDASVYTPLTGVPGSTLNAPLGAASNIGVQPLNLFVTGSAGTSLSTTGIRIDTAPASALQQQLLNQYKNDPYFLVAINTFEANTLTAPASLEEANARFAPALQEVFKGQ